MKSKKSFRKISLKKPGKQHGHGQADSIPGECPDSRLTDLTMALEVKSSNKFKKNKNLRINFWIPRIARWKRFKFEIANHHSRLSNVSKQLNARENAKSASKWKIVVAVIPAVTHPSSLSFVCWSFQVSQTSSIPLFCRLRQPLFKVEVQILNFGTVFFYPLRQNHKEPTEDWMRKSSLRFCLLTLHFLAKL